MSKSVWQYVTPEGHRSAPYASRSEAVIEMVRFCAVRTFAALGVIAEPKRLSLFAAEEVARDIAPDGWRVEEAR